MLKNRSVWNVVVFYVVGVVLVLSLYLGNLQKADFVQASVQIIGAQFTWLAMGVLLNPFAGLAITWSLVVVVMLDTNKGELALAKAKPLVRVLFGRVRGPVIGLAVSAVLAVLIQSLNPNIWANISWLPIAQVLMFLGLRQWKLSSTNSTNA